MDTEAERQPLEPLAKVKGKDLERAGLSGTTAEILQMWEENGESLDVEYSGAYGWTPLHGAAWYGHAEAARALVEVCGALVDSVNSSKDTPLIVAARFNKLSCVEVLLDLGADVTARGFENRTALETAEAKGNAEVVAVLRAAESPMVKSARKS